MPQDQSLSKTQFLTSGIVLLILGAAAELFILAASFFKGAVGGHPIILALAQLIPLIFIEAGIAFIRSSKTMSQTEFGAKEDYNITLRTVGRSYYIYQNLKWILISTVVLVASVAFLIYVLATKSFGFSATTAYVWGFALLYIAVLRWLFVFLRKRTGKTNLHFLTNFWFWGLLVIWITSILLIYFSALSEPIPSWKFTPDWKTWFGGIFGLLISSFLLYGLIFKKDINWEISGGNLALQIPMNFFQKKTAVIPIKNISGFKLVTGAEFLSLQQSFNLQPAIKFGIIKALSDFSKSKVPYPKYYLFASGATQAVYIQGTDFTYLISVEKPEEFVRQLKK